MNKDALTDHDLLGAKGAPADTHHGVHTVLTDPDCAALLVGDAR